MAGRSALGPFGWCSVTAALAAVFFTAAWITGAAYWMVPAVAAVGFAYYNIPLLETGRPTIGATAP